MKLQAVTVSVNYSDFLEHVIESNKKLFDKWIIVTDTKDLKTKELCEKYEVFCIQTDSFYEDGASFNKYAGINEGLKYVDDDAWIMFLDSDIFLHYSTRRILEELHLDPNGLYGVDRITCEGLQKWLDYKNGRDILRENWLLTTEGLTFGARLVHHYGHEGENGRFEGWRPLGFLQLVHRQSFKNYPQDSKTADHCDLLFARQYPRNRRYLIPEIYVIHLESEHAGKAVNWRGRKSQPFAVKKEEVIEEVIVVEEVKKKGCIERFVIILSAFIDIFKCRRKYHHYYGD